MIEMSVNNGVNLDKEDNIKKEVVTTFDTSPTDGLQILREKANAIQEHCTDAVLKNVSLNNLAMYCTDNVFKAKYKHDGEVKFIPFSDFSFGQLCTKLGVPTKYMISCANHGYSDLAIDNLNTWIDDFGKDLLFRVYKDKIRGVLSSRYSIFDTPDIIDVVDDTTRGLGLTVKSFFMNEERFHARIIQQDKMNINGEDLFAGIQIDSSDIGRSTLMVNFFIFKQICTNGLCISKGKANLFTQKHISICSDDFREELKQSLKYLPQLIEEYERYNKAMVSIHSIPLKDVSYYGIMAGHWENREETVMSIDKFCEKPKVSFAEDNLAVKMQNGDKRYYSVFGQYILTPEVFEQLKKNIHDGVVSERGEVELTTALEQVRQKDGLVGVQLDGDMFDMGIPEELRKTSYNFSK